MFTSEAIGYMQSCSWRATVLYFLTSNHNLAHLMLIISWLIRVFSLVTTGIGAKNLQVASSLGTGLESPGLQASLQLKPRVSTPFCLIGRSNPHVLAHQNPPQQKWNTWLIPYTDCECEFNTTNKTMVLQKCILFTPLCTPTMLELNISYPMLIVHSSVHTIKKK